MGTKLRILCLHGHRQDAEIFSQRIEKLTRRLKPWAEFTFVDAPFELPLEDGQSVAMRSWLSDEGCRDGVPDDDLAAACAAIRSAGGNYYDGMVGFSQGGALAAYLAASRHTQPQHVPSLQGLKFLVVAGAFALPGFPRSVPADMPSLHIMSPQDTAVSLAASQDLAKLFRAAQAHTHEQGHAVPMRASDIDVYRAFFLEHSRDASLQLGPGGGEATEEQREELEAIQAIFMDDVLECVFAVPSVSIAVRDTPAGPNVTVSFVLPRGYPETGLPMIKLTGLLPALNAACSEALQAEAEVHEGCAMLFQLVNCAREWLLANATARGVAVGEGQGATSNAAEVVGIVEGGEDFGERSTIVQWLARGEEEEDVVGAEVVREWIRAATQEAVLCADAAWGGEERGKGGLWKFVVGLVGKPSAGKSTLFNALVRPTREEDEAKVGAFPFTTIDPNLGQGAHSVAAPASASDVADGAAPSWGLAGTGERMLPVQVLDVAGLVPGAYRGRGRGNAFLNDLCQADVLIHVLDASGMSDPGGNEVGTAAGAGGEGQGGEEGGEEQGHGPVGDVEWVREEIHRWIYNNIKSKWPSVVRLGIARLVDLLSGYQQPRALAIHALARAGLHMGREDARENPEAVLARFTARDLHRVVAHFLRARFPMVLACNKAEQPQAVAHIAAIREAFPLEPIVPMSARSEVALTRLQRAGDAVYSAGASAPEGVRASDSCGAASGEALEGVVQALTASPVLGGSTGVLAAVNMAVRLRSPVYVFPVAILESCECEGPVPRDLAMEGGGVRGGWLVGGRGAGSAGGVLRDCMMLRPGSTVMDVYECLKRPPWGLVAGDFVRAEMRVLSAAREEGEGAGGEGARDGGVERRPLKKTELVRNGTVLKVFTNRKTQWQSK